MTLKQQLNVDADHIAGAYIEQHPDDDYTQAPLYPQSGAQLDLCHGTITYKLKRELRWARNEPDYSKYMLDKHKWTENTYSEIDWESHRRALNRKHKDRTIITKYLHHITPVGYRVHKYDPKYPQQCPSCPEPVEKQDHLLHCPAPPRQEWRNTMLTTLRTTMETIDTPDDMIELLLSAIKCLLNQAPLETISVPDSVSAIAESQQTIGWAQLLQGRFTEEWRYHYQAYLGPNATEKKNGYTWVTTIITTIFTQWKDLWLLRNQDRHGRDFKTQSEAAHRQAVAEVIQMYEHKPQAEPCHAFIFSIPLHQRQNQTTYVLRAFISNYKPILEESYQTRLETG